MTRSSDPDTLREKAENKREIAAALEELRETLTNAEKIADTPLSKLFHEARTRNTNIHSSVTMFIDYDRESETWEASNVTALQQGEHWDSDARNSSDLLLPISIKPFMDSDVFREQIGWELKESARHKKQDAQRYEGEAKHIEQVRNREESQ